ncbi:MAG: hypothetical protein ACK5HP_01785 [Bacilli bacterium]
MKKNVEHGVVKYKDKDYTYSYKDNIITLTPKELEPYWQSMFKKFKREEKEENVYGITNSNFPVAFIKLNLIDIGGGVLQAFVPAYIVANANTVSPLPEINNFKSMTFYGDCINSLYNPKQMIKDSDVTKKYKPYMKFKHPKEVIKNILVNKLDFIFRITWEFPIKDKVPAVLLKSLLEIKFDSKKTIDEIIEYYQQVKMLFSFINNRHYIEFSDILLKADMFVEDFPDKKVRNVGVSYNLYIILPKDVKVDLPNSIYETRLNKIENQFENLFNTLNKCGGYNLHFPDNQYDEDHVDIDKFLRVASAFESWFDINFDDFKSDTDLLYKILKNDVLKFIAERGKNTNATGRDYLKRFKNEIERQEGTLLEQLLYSYQIFENCVKKVKERIYRHYNLDDVKINDIFLALAKKRNRLSHGDINDLGFSKEEIVAFIILERLIQCLIYYKAEFSLDSISEIVDK